MFSPKRILVPTDFSEHSDAAVERALEIAKTYKSKVYLMNVVDDRIQQCAVDYCLDANLIADLLQDSSKKAKESMEKEVGLVHGPKDVELEYEVRTGTPYKEIVDFQKKNGIDLIVMAPTGKTGMLKNLLGGVADRVMRSASCPVLLLRS